MLGAQLQEVQLARVSVENGRLYLEMEKYQKLVKNHERDRLEGKEERAADRQRHKEEREAKHEELRLDREEEIRVKLEKLKMLINAFSSK